MSDRIDHNMAIKELPEAATRLPPELKSVGARVFEVGECLAIIAREPEGWHLSISARGRDPTWGEIVTARYRLCDGIEEMAMYLPPLSEYVNVHQHTFHLHEIRRGPRLLLPGDF